MLRRGSRLRHLTCFVVVAQERTLARAAARLHLSQPAVSKTLAELEDLAGRRLVERGRAGTQLTPAGEQFLRYAVDVTQALESAAAVLTGAAVPIAPCRPGGRAADRGRRRCSSTRSPGCASGARTPGSACGSATTPSCSPR